ncbi:PP2C family protein-serine/threonine phosphatase [Williamsia deligens]|uniref:Protein phosphatase 2C domain-containing protein n=1 Tax=Williamsia deligens TaxID=321325 RepID=A0ABW3GBD9_9NOCA|nr:protein phosphatase 2C domain-containing protein [Williamsia deligens]MCP2195364.1 protein phosphatase [Williamsia deligens]
MSTDAVPFRDATVAGVQRRGDLELLWSAVSDVGLVRETNEDAAFVADGRFLLADGMGGHDGGEVASENALTALATVQPGEMAQTREAVVTALGDAQHRIEDISPGSGRRAGTTVTGAVVVTYEDVDQWLVLNIGDSRTYRWSPDSFEQVTSDHSQVQELVDAGYLTPEQARVDPRRNVITRALGAGMDAEADFFLFPVVRGEVLLVCSDGLTGELPDGEIAAIVAEHAVADGPDPAALATELVQATLALGARDNVTVVVVMVR